MSMSTNDNPNEDSATDGLPDHGAIANDRLIHGMLELVHKETDAKQQHRITAVLQQLGDERTPHRSRPHRFFRLFTPLASAAILLISVITFFMVSMQSSAYAMMGDAIQATRNAHQLRYEIRFREADSPPGEVQSIGVLEMHRDFLRVEIKMPEGYDFILGRDEQGEWSTGASGVVERHNPRAAAPRWINLGESTILVGSLDTLLDELRNDEYIIERAEDPDPASLAIGLTELIATRQGQAATPGPNRVHVWIHNDTSLVERLEFHWDRPHRDGPPPSQPHGDQPPPPPHRGLLPNPPRFRDNGDPPPPQLIVFQRTPADGVPDGYYAPPSP